MVTVLGVAASRARRGPQQQSSMGRAQVLDNSRSPSTREFLGYPIDRRNPSLSFSGGGPTSSGSCHHSVPEVRDAGRLDGPDLLKLHLRVPEVVEEASTVAEQHWNNVELKLVQQPRCQVLLSDVATAPKQDVFATGGLPCLFERGLDSVGDEVERGPSLCSRSPRPLLAVGLAPGRQRNQPVVEPLAALAERVLLALVRAGDETVQRDRDMTPKLAHRGSLVAAAAAAGTLIHRGSLVAMATGSAGG
jgi:hypothetical protein